MVTYMKRKLETNGAVFEERGIISAIITFAPASVFLR